MITDFSENGLKLLIENGVEEDLHLDYKPNIEGNFFFKVNKKKSNKLAE